jgi:hypothetical protein
MILNHEETKHVGVCITTALKGVGDWYLGTCAGHFNQTSSNA